MVDTHPSHSKRIAIGSDHVGLPLKSEMLHYLQESGYVVEDFGTDNAERTDYPLYAAQVAQAVASGKADRGILICGTGVGMAIAANKVHGIRAVVCSEPYSAALSKQHNDTNILAFGARVVSGGLARMIVDAWLNAEYEAGRHACRVEMITRLEQQEQDQKEIEP